MKLRNFLVLGLLFIVLGCGHSHSAAENTQPAAVEAPPYPAVPNNEVNIADFMEAFNAYRSRYNLPVVKFSKQLSIDAGKNNELQTRYGLGHHFMGQASAQNSAVGYPDIRAVMNGWHNSSGHRVNMQNRSWTCMGIHKIGRYWTQNFSAWKDCQ